MKKSGRADEPGLPCRSCPMAHAAKLKEPSGTVLANQMLGFPADL